MPITEQDLERARTNVMACAYNAAVNYGSERAAKKMRSLIDALNLEMRIKSAVELQALVDQGVIDGFTPCPEECGMRPGGLFHADGCENDWNHPTARARRDAALKRLSQDAYVRATNISLVGRYAVDEHYRREQVRGIAALLDACA